MGNILNNDMSNIENLKSWIDSFKEFGFEVSLSDGKILWLRNDKDYTSPLYLSYDSDIGLVRLRNNDMENSDFSLLGRWERIVNVTQLKSTLTPILNNYLKMKLKNYILKKN